MTEASEEDALDISRAYTSRVRKRNFKEVYDFDCVGIGGVAGGFGYPVC